MKLVLPLMFVYLFVGVNGFAQTTPKSVPVIVMEDDTDIVNDASLDISHVAVKPFDYEIFPTQVESKLQVVLPATEVFTMRLVDEDGNVLFTHFQIFGENQVNLGHLKAAKYFVELSCPKGKVVQEITKT